MGLLVDCIINERMLKVLLESFPGCHPVWQYVGVCFYFIQPGVLSLAPSFNFRAFEQCQEVTTLGDRVFGDVGFLIHQHEPLELG